MIFPWIPAVWIGLSIGFCCVCLKFFSQHNVRTWIHFFFFLLIFLTQIVQPFDNLNVNNNAQYVSQPPTVQQPPTPQYNATQQLYPQLPNVADIPATIPSSTAAARRPQVARNLQYNENALEGQRLPLAPQPTGFTIDAFRLLSVLGRGHFGKVILSQYKKTGMSCRLVKNRLTCCWAHLKITECVLNNSNFCSVRMNYRWILCNQSAQKRRYHCTRWSWIVAQREAHFWSGEHNASSILSQFVCMLPNRGKFHQDSFISDSFPFRFYLQWI